MKKSEKLEYNFKNNENILHLCFVFHLFSQRLMSQEKIDITGLSAGTETSWFEFQLNITEQV
jgi:hypothetical protein